MHHLPRPVTEDQPRHARQAATRLQRLHQLLQGLFALPHDHGVRLGILVQQFLAPKCRQVPPAVTCAANPSPLSFLTTAIPALIVSGSVAGHPQYIDVRKAPLDSLVGLIDVQVFEERVHEQRLVAGLPQHRGQVSDAEVLDVIPTPVMRRRVE